MAASGTISQAGRPAGLLEKLLAVIRPEFRREVLVFDPRDPVFGGPPCAVPVCDRPDDSQQPLQQPRRPPGPAGGSGGGRHSVTSVPANQPAACSAARASAAVRCP